MSKRLVLSESDPFVAGELVRKLQDPSRPLTETERLVLSKALETYLLQNSALRSIKKAWNDPDPALEERIRVAEELRKSVE